MTGRTKTKRRKHVNGIDLNNPFVVAQVKGHLQKDLDHLKHLADWEAWAREDNHAELITSASRLLWITDFAANACRRPMDSPEMRIIAGAANALNDLAARPREIELHRGAIRSGILAAERMWPQLDIFALGRAALEFDHVARTAGLGIEDFNSIRALK
jgi:hypothetical protein